MNIELKKNLKLIIFLVLISFPIFAHSNILEDKQKFKRVLKTAVMGEIKNQLENGNTYDWYDAYYFFRFYEEYFYFHEFLDRVLDLFLKEDIDFDAYYIMLYYEQHCYICPNYSIRAFNQSTSIGKEYNYYYFDQNLKLKDYSHDSLSFTDAVRWKEKADYAYFEMREKKNQERFVPGFYSGSSIIIYNDGEDVKTKKFQNVTSESMLYLMGMIYNLTEEELKNWFNNDYESKIRRKKD